jgi:hypothetical protein
MLGQGKKKTRSHLQRRHAPRRSLVGISRDREIRRTTARGVTPRLSAIVGSAPDSSSALTTPPWPLKEASYSAVRPPSSRWLRVALAMGWPDKYRTTSIWPWPDAPIKGVLDKTQAMVGSAPRSSAASPHVCVPQNSQAARGWNQSLPAHSWQPPCPTASSPHPRSPE